MTEALPMVVVPTFETRCGRTWLTYPEFDCTSSTRRRTGFIHGIAVFRDTSFDTDRRQWLERAKAVVEEGVVREGEGVHPDRIVVPKQVHSARVWNADAPEDGEVREGRGGPVSGGGLVSGGGPVSGGEVECDGLVTGTARVMVGVTVADCVPLLAVNGNDRVVGAAHCGWRGTAGGIVGEFVEAIGALADSEAATRYLIGPSIGQCCYEVGDDMLSHFSPRDREAHVSRRGGRTFFDLKAAVAARLMDRGVSPGQICVDNTCTSCQKYSLSSYRAGGRDCGRMLAFVMLTRRG